MSLDPVQGRLSYKTSPGNETSQAAVHIDKAIQVLSKETPSSTKRKVIPSQSPLMVKSLRAGKTLLQYLIDTSNQIESINGIITSLEKSRIAASAQAIQQLEELKTSISRKLDIPNETQTWNLQTGQKIKQLAEEETKIGHSLMDKAFRISHLVGPEKRDWNSETIAIVDQILQLTDLMKERLDNVSHELLFFSMDLSEDTPRVMRQITQTASTRIQPSQVAKPKNDIQTGMQPQVSKSKSDEQTPQTLKEHKKTYTPTPEEERMMTLAYLEHKPVGW